MYISFRRSFLAPTSIVLAASLAACDTLPKVDDPEQCEPVGTTSATCSEDEGVVCIMITATQDAVTKIESGSWETFEEVALNLSAEIEHTLINSGFNCAVDTRYDLVIVDPDRIEKDGEPVTDALLMTGATGDPYEVVFDNLESLTALESVQQSLNADVVLVMTGKSLPDASEAAGGGFAGMADQISRGDGLSDNAYRKWAVYYWLSETSGPHELGHLLGARHDEEADTGCGTGGAFEYNCGYADDARDVGTIMSYRSSCDGIGGCERVYMFSNPHREHPDYTGVMGTTDAYNACVVHNMWGYTSLASDIYNGSVDPLDAAIDTGLYDVATCPEL